MGGQGGTGFIGRVTASDAAPAGSTSQAVSGGETVTTDPDGPGATTTVPVQTAISVPDGVSGTLSITLQDTSGPSPNGYSFFGKEVVLHDPDATASSPYQATFTVDASLLGGVAPADRLSTQYELHVRRRAAGAIGGHADLRRADLRRDSDQERLHLHMAHDQDDEGLSPDRAALPRRHPADLPDQLQITAASGAIGAFCHTRLAPPLL